MKTGVDCILYSYWFSVYIHKLNIKLHNFILEIGHTIIKIYFCLYVLNSMFNDVKLSSIL